MVRGQSTTLPIIPHTRGSVLLPGVIQRISVSSAGNRPDIPAIIGNIYSRAAAKGPNERVDTVPIACVPVASPFLGPDGQLLLENGEDVENAAEKDEKANLTKADLYGYGVTAKINGVEGVGTGEFALRLEGIARVRIEKITQERPYFEARVKVLRDEVNPGDAELQELFAALKSKSRELVMVLRVSAIIPKSSGLPPILARRLEMFILKKEVQDAGALADFMANIVESTYEEKLQVLAAIDVKERVIKVIDLLDRQVNGLKNNFRITAFTSAPVHILDRLTNRRPASQGPSLPFALFPPGAQHAAGPENPEDGQEPDELEELKKKLEAANLSPEASKVAERELKRLRKMMPANQEYQVTRNWLEILAEIPWSAVTDDRLGKDTLARARKQLDDDHYGLDKVKKRLIEYLAVLRLKQTLNEELDEQISHIKKEMADVDTQTASISPTDEPSTSPERAEEEAQARVRSTKLEILHAKRMVDKSPIMLLVGPPGVGKTSLAKSVATALGRKFHRISLGGVRDEAEIRGHRRTYVAAMPGLIVQGLRKVGVANPVFLLDEIDKLGMSNSHGDPSAAMLEVLDPEQNHTFTDHYIGLPIDLSKVLFIATANSLETIPVPLLDRMETIYLPGYTTLEKRHIAMQHLVPKQVRVNGLGPDQVVFDANVVAKIIEAYTREAGVRNLEREIGSVCRAKAVEFAEARDEGHPESYRSRLTVEDIEEILGSERFEDEIAEKTSRPGIVTGLVAYSSGGNGSILFIEVADMPGNGSVQLTGKLGDVLKESVEVALSWVKAHAYDLGLTASPTTNIMKDRSIHVHCPSGSIPKDGPSSGIAQAIALISLFSGKAVPPTMAMTGEISLRGRVTAVGGIKEKLIGALRAGVTTVLLPAQNRKDVKDLPQEVKDGLQILHVSHIWEAIRLVWPQSEWPGEQRQVAAIESRL